MFIKFSEIVQGTLLDNENLANLMLTFYLFTIATTWDSLSEGYMYNRQT